MGSDNIQVWLASPHVFQRPSCQNILRTWLSPDEIKTLNGFHFEHHQLTYLVAHALLRSALSRESTYTPADWQFETNQFKKPFVPHHQNSRGLHFNISHTNGMVAVALTYVSQIGVDIESPSRTQHISELAGDILCPSEYKDWAQHAPTDQHARLLQYWTLKEAFVKATGQGLSTGLKTFAFDLNTIPQPTIQFFSSAQTTDTRWQFWQYSLPSDHIIALAICPPVKKTISVAFNEAYWLEEMLERR